jgi:hypothetical protein
MRHQSAAVSVQYVYPVPYLVNMPTGTVNGTDAGQLGMKKGRPNFLQQMETLLLQQTFVAFLQPLEFPFSAVIMFGVVQSTRYTLPLSPSTIQDAKYQSTKTVKSFFCLFEETSEVDRLPFSYYQSTKVWIFLSVMFDFSTAFASYLTVRTRLAVLPRVDALALRFELVPGSSVVSGTELVFSLKTGMDRRVNLLSRTAFLSLRPTSTASSSHPNTSLV